MVNRQAAINIANDLIVKISGYEQHNHAVNSYSAELMNLPPAEPKHDENPLQEQVDDILQYLDDILHPIVSPEHWSVYSELHDMVSKLQSAQTERPNGEWIPSENEMFVHCSRCGCQWESGLVKNCNMKFCPSCGKYNGG
jgi:hypothetical protein